jgi:hypothetical protein
VGHVVCMDEVRNAYKILLGKPEWKGSLRIPMHILNDNITWVLEKYIWRV